MEQTRAVRYYQDNRIWDVLHETGNTLTELARSASVDLGFLSRAARKRQTVSAQVAARIAVAVDMPIVDMFSQPVYRALPPLPRPTFEQRFWSLVERRADDACWPWHGALAGPSGYQVPVLSTHQTSRSVVRYAWELAFGPVPEGRIVRRTCRDALCLNPAHLRLSKPHPPAAHRRPTANARQAAARQGYEHSTYNHQANEFLNLRPTPTQSFATWARAHGLNEAHIAAHEARIRPPQRVMCQVCPGCGLLVPDDEGHACRVRVAA